MVEITVHLGRFMFESIFRASFIILMTEVFDVEAFAWSLDVDIGNIVEKSAMEGMRKIVYFHTSFLCGIH